MNIAMLDLRSETLKVNQMPKLDENADYTLQTYLWYVICLQKPVLSVRALDVQTVHKKKQGPMRVARV